MGFTIAHAIAPKPLGSSTAARPLLFLHIPKTAGTSMLTALRNMFGDSRIVRLTGAATLTSQPVDDLVATGMADIACVAGHLPAYLLRHHLSRFRPFAILRNPVSRVLSLYRFLHRADAVELARLGLQPGFTLVDFLAGTEPELVAQINNGMCRMLGGDESAFAVDGGPVHENPDMLARSVAILRQADFGLSEAMPATRALFSDLWNLPGELDASMDNTTEGADEVYPPDLLAEIVARNQLDLALYAWATAEFPARLAAAAHGIAASTDALFRPALYADVSVADIAGRRGFHELEPDGFCWLKSERPAAIHFQAPAPGARLRLNFYCMTEDYDIAAIALRVNGQAVAHVATWTEPHWCTLETDRLPLEGSSNLLTIDPPSFLSVRRVVHTTADDRYLSVALHTMTLFT